MARMTERNKSLFELLRMYGKLYKGDTDRRLDKLKTALTGDNVRVGFVVDVGKNVGTVNVTNNFRERNFVIPINNDSCRIGGVKVLIRYLIEQLSSEIECFVDDAWFELSIDGEDLPYHSTYRVSGQYTSSRKRHIVETVLGQTALGENTLGRVPPLNFKLQSADFLVNDRHAIIHGVYNTPESAVEHFKIVMPYAMYHLFTTEAEVLERIGLPYLRKPSIKSSTVTSYVKSTSGEIHEHTNPQVNLNTLLREASSKMSDYSRTTTPFNNSTPQWKSPDANELKIDVFDVEITTPHSLSAGVIIDKKQLKVPLYILQEVCNMIAEEGGIEFPNSEDIGSATIIYEPTDELGVSRVRYHILFSGMGGKLLSFSIPVNPAFIPHTNHYGSSPIDHAGILNDFAFSLIDLETLGY